MNGEDTLGAYLNRTPSKFKTQLYLKTLLKKQNKTFICPICKTRFHHKKTMKQHKQDEHGVKINSNLTIEYIILPQQQKEAD